MHKNEKIKNPETSDDKNMVYFTPTTKSGSVFEVW